MNIDEFLALAKSRRSCRVFKSGPPIPDTVIRKVLDAARWAESGANGQPWEFIVVKDPETLKKLNEICLEEKWESYYIEQLISPEYRQPILDREPQGTGWEEVNTLIVVVGDRRTLQATVRSANYISAEGGPGSVYLKNIANTTQILHLAIFAAGYATRWVSITRSNEEQIKRLLGVPDVLDIHTMVPIGYPAYEYLAPYRRKLDDIVHNEKYDMGKFRTVQDITEFLAFLRTKQRSDYHRLFPDK
jgi:nitroreductase